MIDQIKNQLAKLGRVVEMNHYVSLDRYERPRLARVDHRDGATWVSNERPTLDPIERGREEQSISGFLSHRQPRVTAWPPPSPAPQVPIEDAPRMLRNRQRDGAIRRGDMWALICWHTWFGPP